MKNRTMTMGSVGRFSAFALVAVAALAACGSKSKDATTGEEEEEASSTPANNSKSGTTGATTGGGETPKSTTATAPTADTAQPPKTAVEAHVKAELDNRSDGLTGTPLPAKDAKALVQVATTWKPDAKGDVSVAMSADGKNGIATSASDGSQPKLDAATAALGLTACQWNPVENVTVGKDKLASTAADGVCQKGGASVHTAYVLDLADSALVVGAWDNDMKSVFDSMRTLSKVVVGTVNSCCDALQGNMANAPPQQKIVYAAAIAICNGLKSNPQGRTLLGQVRSALPGVSIPSTCN